MKAIASALIRKLSAANPSWGAPRIVGELRKLGVDVAKSAVDKCLVRSKQPPSPTWNTFLSSNAADLGSTAFFVVSTVRFKVLFVLVVLAHHRRTVLHFSVTEHPTAQWTRQQPVEAFPWDTAPKYLLRIGTVFMEAGFKSKSKARVSKRC
jgi:putative transposase